MVLDIGLPTLDGWEILERIRDLSDVPVLILTAHGNETDKVRGLQGGADDYLTKPFGNRELAARVQALLRRPRTGQQAEGYDDGNLLVKLRSREVRVHDAPVAAAPQARPGRRGGRGRGLDQGGQGLRVPVRGAAAQRQLRFATVLHQSRNGVANVLGQIDGMSPASPLVARGRILVVEDDPETALFAVVSAYAPAPRPPPRCDNLPGTPGLR